MNKEWLVNDVKFPLTWDCDEYKMYIFDADQSMIAMVYYDIIDATQQEHPFEKLVGDYKDVEPSDNPKWALKEGHFYCTKLGLSVGCVRSWGRLSNKYGHNQKAEDHQDNIAEYLLNVMNDA